jgi:tripeptidyl-peptidase-1
LLIALAVVARAADVRMEPSVNTFSSTKWLKEKASIENDVIQTTFALKHNKAALADFERTLLDISNPKSANYGKWLSRDEIKARIAPAAASIKTVVDYVASFGVPSKDIRVNKMGDMVTVHMPIKTANKMLKTEFALFRSVTQRNIAIPRVTKPYYLPEEVAEHVQIVADIIRFPALRQGPTAFGYEEGAATDPEFNTCGTKCNGYTTPDVLSSAYNFDYMTSFAPGNSMSVAEFQYQYYDNTDLESFGTACGVTATVETTIGGNNPKVCEAGGCVEALLDIEYIEAIAHPVPLTVIYSSTFSLLDWVNQVMDMDNPPWVHSVSYGNDEVQQTSVEYMDTCNVQFQAAGAMGLSILFASGDQGVWGRSGVGATYNPDFPASSPWITAVGGTNFQTKSVIGPESTWDCGGGGFSDTFARPDWQVDAVNSYIAAATAAGVLPSQSLWNATGRAYPDVAALGGQTNPYCVAIKGGSFGGVAGTSASCPVVAGIIAQLNDVRFRAGQTALGWLNQFIYQNGQCFNDVNDGSMNNCNKGTTGFAALDGWDPATGFGSPNFACLKALMPNV